MIKMQIFSLLIVSQTDAIVTVTITDMKINMCILTVDIANVCNKDKLPIALMTRD